MENKSNKRKRAKITTEVIEEIQKLENEGLTNRQIADRLGISIRSVIQHKCKKRAKITTEVIEEIQKLENEGLTNRQIADRLDISIRSVIQHKCKKGK